MTMSNRYLSAMSRSTAPISESGRISATAGTCVPVSRPPAVQTATRTCGLRRMRSTLPGGGVGLHQEPAVPQDIHLKYGDAQIPGRLSVQRA